MIMNHDLLQGILFGFGRNNAYLFEQNMRNKLVYFSVHPYFLDRLISSEIAFAAPGFVCDPTTEETKQLQEKYDYGCKLLYWTYFKRDFLKTTLAFFND